MSGATQAMTLWRKRSEAVTPRPLNRGNQRAHSNKYKELRRI